MERIDRFFCDECEREKAGGSPLEDSPPSAFVNAREDEKPASDPEVLWGEPARTVEEAIPRDATRRERALWRIGLRNLLLVALERAAAIHPVHSVDVNVYAGSASAVLQGEPGGTGAAGGNEKRCRDCEAIGALSEAVDVALKSFESLWLW